MLNAMLIDAKDNVVVAIEAIAPGDTVTYMDGDTAKSFTAVENITIFHKVARFDIPKGEAVSKYGEHIGLAGCDVAQGKHVHVHNVESHREQLV